MEVKDEQPEKIRLKSITLLVFHLDISGNEINDEQLMIYKNKKSH